MNFTMHIERYNDFGNDADGVEELSIIIKIEDHILIRLEYTPIKNDCSSFTLCEDGKFITIEYFKNFIEKFEQNLNDFLIFKEDDGENSFIYSYNALYITNRCYDNFLQVVIPIDQNIRSNFAEGFQKFLEEVKDICNIVD